MKKIIPFIFILTIILAGCGSSKKQLEKGNYNAAIDKAVKQLRKDPNDAKADRYSRQVIQGGK